MNRVNQTYAWHFEPPTSAEFQTLLDRWGLSRAAAGEIVDTTAKSIQRYATMEQYSCTFAVLYVLANECEAIKITKGGWREELRV